MADPAAFSACLTHLGFDAPTRQLLNDQGIGTMGDLLHLPSVEVDRMVQHLSRWRPRAADDGEDQAPAATFPYLAVRKLKALRIWADYRTLRGQVPTPAVFDGAVIGRFLNRLTELEEAARTCKDDEDIKTPSQFASMSSWPSWMELFKTFLGQHRSVVAGTPLSYVIRDEDAVTPEMLAAVYDSVDDDLIGTSMLEGEAFVRDNQRVYDLLKPLIIEGPGWPFMQPLNRHRDGRGAFKALKAQAEGRSAVATRKAKAYAMIATANFTGKGHYSFDQYVAAHQKAHNELLDADEPVAETKKVTDFLANIQDPKLEIAIQSCMGDEQRLTNFELCQQYFKTIVENSKTRAKTASGQRTVARVGMEKDKKKSKVKKKTVTGEEDRTPSGIAIHAGKYSPKDYNKLKPFEKLEVKRLREVKANESRNVSAATTLQVESKVKSQVESQVEDTSVDSEQVTPTSSNAGNQFGRNAHGGHKKQKKST
jgi:hypothetical protein